VLLRGGRQFPRRRPCSGVRNRGGIVATFGVGCRQRVAAEPTPPLYADPSEYILTWKRVFRILAAAVAICRFSGIEVLMGGE
jgi:hypothetical protein